MELNIVFKFKIVYSIKRKILQHSMHASVFMPVVLIGSFVNEPLPNLTKISLT